MQFGAEIKIPSDLLENEEPSQLKVQNTNLT